MPRGARISWGPMGPKNHTFKKSWPPWAFWSPLGILDFLKVQFLKVGVSIYERSFLIQVAS